MTIGGCHCLKDFTFFCDPHMCDHIDQFKTKGSLGTVILMGAANWLAQGLLQVVFFKRR